MAVTMGDLARVRFPRLLAALQRVADLTEPGAVEVLVEYHVFGISNEPTTPAVTRLGGQLAAIRYAIRHRGSAHRLATGAAVTPSTTRR